MKGVTRQGAKGSPAIILLHGGVINRHMWGPVVEHLDDHYDCVSIDLPAYGELIDEQFTVNRAVERVVEVLDDLEIKVSALVGLSLGG